MKIIRHGRLSTFAILIAALGLPRIAFAQTQTATSPQTTTTVAKPAAAKGPSVTPPPTAITVARPAGLKGEPVVITATPAAVAKKPGHEGVAMHGHWIIDLRNADGAVAEHRDFENSLLSPTDLLYLVTGEYVSGDLGITIASTGSLVCTTYPGTTGGLGGCLVAASSTAGLGGFTGCAGSAAGFCNYNLKEVVNGGGGNGTITLSGTMPVLASGAVTEVGTQLFACNTGGTGSYSGIDPIGCYNQTEGGGYFWGNLTGTSITPLNVTTGQTIAFTVVLTFS
ncbi:hypothetical protein SAMN05421770_10273 [Granulicella rosea]|uniref:Uncharacterized protein n=1 Tax=Granulicella rosea TaxID=474952 RepID=A0A239GT37_9BACT|nr:hypothetical protein [Granulicella rosea]SNS72389.1 hypothetical protein SAMN05421770_10273 [Granulicella rosea]